MLCLTGVGTLPSSPGCWGSVLALLTVLSVLWTGMPEMPRHHREGRGLQPHGLSEPELQGGVLLGVSGPLGAPRICLVSSGACLAGRRGGRGANGTDLD